MERPLTETSPVKSPPVKLGTKPLISPSRVDLPEPVLPTTNTNSPAWNCQIHIFKNCKISVAIFKRYVFKFDHAACLLYLIGNFK